MLIVKGPEDTPINPETSDREPDIFDQINADKREEREMYRQALGELVEDAKEKTN